MEEQHEDEAARELVLPHGLHQVVGLLVREQDEEEEEALDEEERDV